MARENVDTVRRAYEALDREGVDALLEYFHPDLEYDITTASGPFAGMYHGHAEVRRFLVEYFDSWDYVRLVPEDFIEVGADQIVVPLRLQMRGKGSGIEVSAATFNTWTLREGRAVRVAVRNDRDEALRAGGTAGGVSSENAAAGLSDAEVVRRMWDAFLEGDLQAALACGHPDLEWDGTNLPDGQLGRGHEAVVDHIKRWADQWEAWTVEVEEIIDAGEGRVVVIIRERGRSKSGAEMDERHAELYDVRDGLVVRRQGFSDPREALEAVGLSE